MAEEPKSKRSAGVTGTDDSSASPHPSRSLRSRARGYGIAAGYEKAYQPKTASQPGNQLDEYGPIPHSGYYGAGDSARPFKRGQAGYSEELLWYPAQFGEETSGYEPAK